MTTNDHDTIPVIRDELTREAERIMERHGMPDDATHLAALVLSWLEHGEPKEQP